MESFVFLLEGHNCEMRSALCSNCDCGGVPAQRSVACGRDLMGR